MTEVEVTDPQTQETHTEYECDWNDFYCPAFEIDTDDVVENPGDYIDYKPENVDGAEKRLRDIEDALVELVALIGG